MHEGGAESLIMWPIKVSFYLASVSIVLASQSSGNEQENKYYKTCKKDNSTIHLLESPIKSIIWPQPAMKRNSARFLIAESLMDGEHFVWKFLIILIPPRPNY